MFEYQVSLFCKSGKYRPVSTIVRRKVQVDLTNATDKKKIMNDGIIKICQMREYDKEKIEREKKERYEKIKEQHYQDGSWKRPKKKD